MMRFKFFNSLLLSLCAWATVRVAIAAASKGNIDYVNPFIGTQGTDQHHYGGMIPSVATPFAMTRWTPMTRHNFVGICPYVYTDDSFLGFLGTHQPALWMGESGEIGVSAGLGKVELDHAKRGHKLLHDTEVSSPYYYKTHVKTVGDETYLAELTATSRASHLRFTFDRKVAEPYAIVEVTRRGIEGYVSIDKAKREISGWNPERDDTPIGPFVASQFKGYFVAVFDIDFSSFGLSVNDSVVLDGTIGEGSSLKTWVTFPQGTKSFGVRIGMSYISLEQARVNLEQEIPSSTDFEQTSAFTMKQWNNKLDLINISGATDDQREIFYTAMYHALQYPNEMTEKNITGSFYYSGYDDRVHQGDYAYTGYSNWDIFRAEWALLILLAPERIHGMVQSMLQTYEQGGRLPLWQNIVETNIMIGTHSSSLIAEALVKGFHEGFDMEVLWQAVWKDAMVPPDNDLTTSYYNRQHNVGCEARAGLTLYMKNGWVPAVMTSDAGSRTLEYAYDDFTVSVIADILGRKKEAAYFHTRSKYYRNVFNNETKFMEARFANGSWCSLQSTWTEGTKYIYTFAVQHDFAGLRDLLEGSENLEARLNDYYENGHNDQSNEPSHATVFAYLYANKPDKAQSTIRKLLKDNYFTGPNGLIGQDDCGQMSAWYIFNALGFYPANPSSGEFLIGTPLFEEVNFTFPVNGKTLTIKAANAASQPFIASVSLDNEPLAKPVLPYFDLIKSNELVFAMSNEPQTWGSNAFP